MLIKTAEASCPFKVRVRWARASDKKPQEKLICRRNSRAIEMSIDQCSKVYGDIKIEVIEWGGV